MATELSAMEFSWDTYKKNFVSRVGYGFMSGIAAGSIMYFVQGLFLAPRG